MRTNERERAGDATVTVRVVTANGRARTRRFWGTPQADGSILLPNGIRVRR